MTKHTPPFSPKVRERAVRLVLDNQGEHGSLYAAIRSVAAKIGCTAETLRGWVRQAERDLGAGAAGRPGLRAGPTTDERERLKALERVVRQANEILRKASAYFAQAELDRRSRT
jgi:transposase-like protein